MKKVKKFVQESKKMNVFSSYNLIEHKPHLNGLKEKAIDKLSTKNSITTLENFLPYFKKKKIQEFSLERWSRFRGAVQKKDYIDLGRICSQPYYDFLEECLKNNYILNI